MKDPTSPILHEMNEIHNMIQTLECRIGELFERKRMLEESLEPILTPEVGKKLAHASEDKEALKSGLQEDSSLLIKLKDLTFDLIELNEKMVKLDKDLFELRGRIQI